MASVSISHLKRNPEYIKDNLMLTKDNRIIVKKDTVIHIPKRFNIKGMLILGEENYSIGIFPIIMDGMYSLFNVLSLIHLSTPNIDEFTLDEIDYYSFSYEKGSEFIKNTKVVRDDNITYNVFDELISNGNVPWYLEYLDLARIYDTSGKYADSKMGFYRQPFHIIVSMLARTQKDRMKLYRYTLNEKKDLSYRPEFVPLKSVMFVAQSTLNKIAGSYMDEGVVSALVYPSEHAERIETLLRE